MQIKRIVVIACGPFDFGTLQSKTFSTRFHFYFEPIKTEPKDIIQFISYIVNKYKSQNVDGVLGTHDGPESLVAAIIAKELGLNGMNPVIAFICEHKYYSRRAQKRITPLAVPNFQCLPINGLQSSDIALSYPFFVKPVKSAFSILAKTIHNFEELEDFMPKIQKRLSLSLPPFNILINKYSSLKLDGNYLIAEQLLDGEQFTIEGFSWNKRVTIMGITDSIMYPGTLSFQRFEYPSKLPKSVQHRMENIAAKLVLEIGLDYTLFNIEMFYNPEKETIHIIEINPRMSYQFADLFEKVDGTNSYNIQLQLSQGEQPVFEQSKGQFRVAASFVLRLFEDKLVTRSPTEEELNKIKTKFPDSFVIIKVKKGNKLSDVSQDEKSYRYAIINLGGDNWTDLYSRFGALRKLLEFDFDDLHKDEMR
jgi:hypothetical protein